MPSASSSPPSTGAGRAADDERRNLSRVSARNPGFRFEAREQALVNRRHRRRPGRLRLPAPRRKAVRIEAGSAANSSPRPHGREQRSDETVDMEERHRVEADVLRRQPEGRRHVPGRGQQVALRQRHKLRASGRAGCVQQQGDDLGCLHVVLGPPDGAASAHPHCPTRGVRLGDQLEQRQAHVRGELSGRGLDSGFDGDRVRAQVGKRELELGSRVGRVQRRTPGGGGNPEERGRRLGPVSRQQRDAAGWPDPPFPQHRPEALDEREEPGGGERVTARRAEDGDVGTDPGPALDHLGERRGVLDHGCHPSVSCPLLASRTAVIPTLIQSRRAGTVKPSRIVPRRLCHDLRDRG